ncbi:MAG: DUF4065 domain-containing protein [Lachnospiraceae bacterium]|nr:DUF4065 domain-containing protein [Lachnospiraceae bacterium]
MLTIDSLAKVILSCRDDISNKKLQKLAYYVYAWYLTIHGTEIADISFEAWEHGPVCRRLYNNYRSYGWNEIPRFNGFVLANDDDIKFVETVLDVYGDYTADELEEMTHNDAPWQEARRGCPKHVASDAVITKQSIVQFYNTQMNIRDRIVNQFKEN